MKVLFENIHGAENSVVEVHLENNFAVNECAPKENESVEFMSLLVPTIDQAPEILTPCKTSLNPPAHARDFFIVWADLTNAANDNGSS